MRTPSRLLRIVLGMVAVAAALFITYVYPKHNGLDLDIDNSVQAQEARRRDPYDLSEQRVLLRTVMEVTRNYVDPGRVNWRRMLLSGLNAIQRSVAPILVHYEDGQDTFTVQVHDKRQQFMVKDVTSPWKLTERFGQVFKFIQPNLTDEDINPRDVEYSAVNGMLRTLDPHTVLLTPDTYEQMRMSTRGEFGGLGIVISVRDDELTVIKPMENTPASRAGLKKGDKITKINDEPTLNMPLNDAVDRLRGAPGSDVVVWATRPGKGGFPKPKRFDLTRAVIQIPSVDSRMLADGIGYVHIKSFQGNTDTELETALSTLHQKGLKGLVLDLRDDPGGLLEQAVRVADKFLTSGTIVVTSSNNPNDRDEKFARAEGTEPNYPMVALVNGRSASASEIVAGALKAHDRALIVGERTFGKGSVQVLYEFEDGSSLKLTIAQYLTPGDVSIQEVGIVPDIAIDPMTVDAEDMDLTLDTDFLREADLGQHLTSDRVRASEKPSATIHYYLPAEARRELREASADDDDSAENTREEEFLLRFAQALLKGAPQAGRVELLANSRDVVTQVGDAEMKRALIELQKLGIDWSVGEDKGASDVDVSVTTDRPENRGVAGDPFSMKIAVTNKGKAPLYQLRAKTKSDYGLFNEREFIFGKLMPGQTREWTAPLGICEGEAKARKCTVPKSMLARADGLRVVFEEAHGHVPKDAELRTTIDALVRPRFAYSLQLADPAGNGDGVAQKGESLTYYLRVKNVGLGKAEKTGATLRNLSGRGVSLRDGRFKIDSLAPGEEWEVPFTFEVLPDFDRDEVKLEVMVYDTELREAVSEKLTLPLSSASAAPKAAAGTATLKVGAKLYESASDKASVVAKVGAGPLSLTKTAELGNFVRFDSGNGRPVWAAKGDFGQGASTGKVEWVVDRMPPHLDVDYGHSLVTRDAVLKIKGKAQDDRRVRDLYVFVGPRKVFYDAPAGSAKSIDFAATVPLRPGTNYITVFARESQDVVSRETFVVRRDGADGALLETPKHFDDGAEWDEVGDDSTVGEP